MGLYKNNTTGYTGISVDKRCEKYRVSIAFKGKRYSLGYFKNLDDAVKARRDAEDYFNFTKTDKPGYSIVWFVIRGEETEELYNRGVLILYECLVNYQNDVYFSTYAINELRAKIKDFDYEPFDYSERIEKLEKKRKTMIDDYLNCKSLSEIGMKNNMSTTSTFLEIKKIIKGLKL